MQIVILGMHRSGTSTVARVINLMGANVGRADLLGRPAQDNPKGFWERRDVRELNDEILNALGCHWDDVASFDMGRLPEAEKKRFGELIQGILFELEASRPWVMKDPRLCLTFSLWRPYLEAPVCVIPLRHPNHVAGSLYKRNQLPLAMGLALWESYVRAALQAAHGLPCVFVNYDELLADPTGIGKVLYDQLIAQGVTGLRMPSDAELQGFIDPALRHHSSTLLEEQGTLPHVTALYQQLCAMSDSSALTFLPQEPPELQQQLLAYHHQNRLALLASETTANELRNRFENEIGQLEQRHNDELLRTTARLQEAEQQNRALEQTLEQALKEHEQQRVHSEQQLTTLQQLQGRTEQQLHDVTAKAQQLRELYEQLFGNTQQLARWLGDALRLADASFHSMRWTIGHAVCRVLEVVLRRGNPRLAKDDLNTIAQHFSTWQLNQLELYKWIAPTTLSGVRTADTVSAISPAVGAASQRFAVAEKQAGRFDIICFPVIDWHFRIQRPQHLARELGKAGHRVFYLSTQVSTGCAEAGYEITESPAQNVYLVQLRTTLSQAPNVYQDVVGESQSSALIQALNSMLLDCEISTPVMLIDLPFWHKVARLVNGSVLIYDCMDYHAGFSTNNPAMLAEEDALIDEADAVVVTSAYLQDLIEQRRPVAVIKNAGEIAHFKKADKHTTALSERPVIGYIGAIADWFDFDLIAAAARRCPEYDFVLVGAVTVKIKPAIKGLPNLKLIGEIPYEQAPVYVRAFDVCLIPFKINELTIATNPVKVYEYLAAGKPVVTTDLPELRDIGNLVSIAHDQEEFIGLLQKAVQESDNPDLPEARVAWAENHDWEHRAQDLQQVISAQFPSVSVVVLTWNNLDLTKACLESLAKYTHYPNWELIIVDNASSDDTPAFLTDYAEKYKHTTVIFNDSNLGFAAGNNVGIKAAQSDYIVLLNNDTYVTPGWLQGLIGHLRRNDKFGIIGPVTNNIGNEAKIDIHYDSMDEMILKARAWTQTHTRQYIFTQVVAFFCCAFSRHLVAEIGLLDENFEVGFFEDDDYCRRIQKLGLQVVIAEDVFVHHHLSASFNTLEKEKRNEIFERNKVRFEEKWGEWKPHEYR